MMKRLFKKGMTCLGFVIILMLIGNDLNTAQEKIGSNGMIVRNVSGSGGILYSSSNNYFHSATAGEVIVGGMNSTKNIILSGFWASRFPEPTEVENNLSQSIPDKYQVHQNYPNPFNPTTTIEYDIPELSTVNIEIYNMTGQRVRHLIKSKMDKPGYQKIIWDARNDNGNKVASGAYFYRVIIISNQADDLKNEVLFQQTKKMLFVK